MSSVLMTNNVTHRTGTCSGLPSSLFSGVFVFLIQMASFICQVLRLGSLSMIFAPFQSVMWFSVIAWSVSVDF